MTRMIPLYPNASVVPPGASICAGRNPARPNTRLPGSGLARHAFHTALATHWNSLECSKNAPTLSILSPPQASLTVIPNPNSYHRYASPPASPVMRRIWRFRCFAGSVFRTEPSHCLNNQYDTVSKYQKCFTEPISCSSPDDCSLDLDPKDAVCAARRATGESSTSAEMSNVDNRKPS